MYSENDEESKEKREVRRGYIIGYIIFCFVLPTIFTLAGKLVDYKTGKRRLLGFPHNLLVGIPIMLAGAFLSFWGQYALAKYGEGHVFSQPSRGLHHAPTELVTEGPYRFMKNPIDTGASISYFAHAFIDNSPGELLVVFPLWMLVITLFHRYQEEPALEKEFGEEYRAYRKEGHRLSALLGGA